MADRQTVWRHAPRSNPFQPRNVQNRLFPIPPSNGLIMTDLTQDAIAFREQLDHFWNKFVL